MANVEWSEAFGKMLPEVEAYVTLRLNEFHQAMVERGQIAPPPPARGITVDCKERQDGSLNPSQSRFG